MDDGPTIPERHTIIPMRSAYALAARAVMLLMVFVVTAGATGVVASALFLPAAQMSSVVAHDAVRFFDSLPTDLAEVPLSQRSVMLARDGSVLARFYDENRTVVPLSKVSSFMRAAIVSIEDSRFYDHGGVDTRGVLRAAANNALGRSIQGASTLTQQFVKNMLVEQALAKGNRDAANRATSDDYGRKIREMKLAISLETKYSKDKILEGYLNIANFGDGTYGVEAASWYYFHRHAAQLTLSEAATLAGLVQAPAEDSPRTHLHQAQARRDVVLARMRQLGVITPVQYQVARRTPLAREVHLTRTPNGCASAGPTAFFCDYVVQELLKGSRYKALGRTPEARRQMLYRGGLTVRTSLDPRLEQAAWHAVNKHIPYDDPGGISTAAVTVRPGTGEVLAMVENRVFSLTDEHGGTALNYAVDENRTGTIGFQPGSTFKPFTLATWLAAGKSAGTTVDASNFHRPFSDFRRCGKRLRDHQVYDFTNSEGTETGRMSVFQATYESVNSAYVDMESQLDLCDVAQTAEALGVHRAAPVSSSANCGVAPTGVPTCFPSLTLGILNVSPLTMASAYATFAAGGRYCPPDPVLRILGRGTGGRPGRPLGLPAVACTQALSPGVAAGVAAVLRQTIENPAGTAHSTAQIGRPAGGKTGTTDHAVDTWFDGFTPQLSTSVWVGDLHTHRSHGQEVRNDLHDVTIKGKHYSVIYGYKMAAPIWNDIMSFGSEGLPVVDFPKPPAALVRGSRTDATAGGAGKKGHGQGSGSGTNGHVPATPGHVTPPGKPTG